MTSSHSILTGKIVRRISPPPAVCHDGYSVVVAGVVAGVVDALVDAFVVAVVAAVVVVAAVSVAVVIVDGFSSFR